MITSQILTDKAIDDRAIGALAELRIAVFRHWPYLYQGDLDYERRYLKRYRSPDSVVVAAHDGDKMIGAATAAPMEDHAQEFGKAFSKISIKIEEIFYLAESVLLPEYRGQGLGHVFFDGREAQARKLRRKFCAFCSVIRAADHPERPVDYRPLDGFWHKRGYQKLEGVIASFPWKDIGDTRETSKQMQFWIRAL